MRGIWTRLSDDEGMTLVEIVVSAAIMFIILTGVLGLVGQTTLMGLQAKQKNVMTNALNAYIEWVTSLPFDQVALVDDGGALSAESTQTIGGYQVGIRPTVENVTGNSALKNLTVDVTITDARGAVSTHSTRVAIRDRSQSLTQPAPDPLTDPTIEFIGLTPPPYTVVWGDEWAGGPLYLDVKADASDGRVIKIVRISFDGIACDDATAPFPRTAVWTPEVQHWTSTAELFAWSTDQFTSEEQDDGSFVDKRLVEEGMVTVEAWCVDSMGIEDKDSIYLLVDNFAPAAPGNLLGTVVTNDETTLSWDRAMDGDLGAEWYEVRWVVQESGDTDDAASPFGTWAEAGSYDWLDAAEYGSDTMSRALATTTFSRYAARIRALSPRDLASDWVETTFVTRPLVGGTYTVTRPTNTSVRTISNLAVTPPTFPTVGSPVYTWYRAVGTGAYAVLPGKTTPTITDTCDQAVQNKNMDWKPVRYYVKVDYVADGYAGSAGSVQSNNLATVTGLATPTATLTYAEGTW